MVGKKTLTIETGSKSKYIVPPRLVSRMIDFKYHVQVAKGEPILITGATGVGKSLFLHIFEKLWMKEHPKSPIIWANCAHFGGPNSDPNVARSELFGVDPKFASLLQGSRKINGDVVGLIKLANGGALILEEIGELPLEVQAMLLTFIETGIYRRVGEPKRNTRYAKVSIIGATNRESALREDFRFRFFPFFVPSIYERRDDILYYLQNKFPDIVKTLTPFETLSLLAYNWPGNVREIERIGMLIERHRYSSMEKFGGVDPFVMDYYRLLTFTSNDTALNVDKVIRLRNDMKRNNVNMNSLEILLNCYGLGFDRENRTLPFKSLSILKTQMDDTLDVQLVDSCNPVNKPVHNAIFGYHLLCSLLFQHPDCDYNLFDLGDNRSIYCFPDEVSEVYNITEKSFNLFQQLMIPIFNYLSGLKLPTKTLMPTEYVKRQIFFTELASKYPSNKFLASFTEIYKPKNKDLDTNPDIFSMPFDDFMKYYYTTLIDSVDGNKAEAARRIKVNYQTFQTRLNIYDVK